MARCFCSQAPGLSICQEVLHLPSSSANLQGNFHIVTPKATFQHLSTPAISPCAHLDAAKSHALHIPALGLDPTPALSTQPISTSPLRGGLWRDPNWSAVKKQEAQSKRALQPDGWLGGCEHQDSKRGRAHTVMATRSKKPKSRAVQPRLWPLFGLIWYRLQVSVPNSNSMVVAANHLQKIQHNIS